MPSTIQHIEDLVTKAGDIAETKMELIKLRATGKIAETTASLISLIAIVILTAITITVLSIGVAFWIGSEMDNLSYGFFIIGGFYIIICFLVYFLRKKWIKAPVSNLIVDKIIK